MRNTKGTSSMQEPLTIASLVQTRIDNLSVRRILEILVPVRIFVEIDEFGRAHLLGATNCEGHFQVGTLVNLKEWTPTQDQDDIRWQQIEEPGYVLHLVERRPRLRKTDMEVALIRTLPMIGTESWNRKIAQKSHVPRLFRIECWSTPCLE